MGSGTTRVCTHSWWGGVWLHGWAGWRGGGGEGGGGVEGTRTTAPYCQPAVAACEALLNVPLKAHLLTHTHTCSEMHKGATSHTHTLFFFSERVVFRKSLAPLGVPLFFCCCFRSSLEVRSTPSRWSPLWKIKEEEEGVRRTNTREGQKRGGHVSEWGKMTLHHVVRPALRPRRAS